MEVLSIDPSPLYVQAGYLPADVRQILYRYPVEAPTVLREAFDEYTAVAGPVEQRMKRRQSDIISALWVVGACSIHVKIAF